MGILLCLLQYKYCGLSKLLNNNVSSASKIGAFGVILKKKLSSQLSIMISEENFKNTPDSQLCEVLCLTKNIASKKYSCPVS